MYIIKVKDRRCDIGYNNRSFNNLNDLKKYMQRKGMCSVYATVIEDGKGRREKINSDNVDLFESLKNFDKTKNYKIMKSLERR